MSLADHEAEVDIGLGCFCDLCGKKTQIPHMIVGTTATHCFQLYFLLSRKEPCSRRYSNFVNACGIIDTACTNKFSNNFEKLKSHARVHAVSMTPHAKYDTACKVAFENRAYLGEFEAEFKKALARESGAQGVLFDEKTEG
jgi:hypothetical protein